MTPDERTRWEFPRAVTVHVAVAGPAILLICLLVTYLWHLLGFC